MLQPFGTVLKRPFYSRQAEEVARDLLGRVLRHGECAGRIVETEAYLGGDDLAAHSARGVTPRTRVIFGPPGRAYVYFIYGMHECLNLICEPEGSPGCVLIRALEPVAGIERMRLRRGKEAMKDLTSGPGKLTQAMGITRAHNGVDVTKGDLVIYAGHGEEFDIQATPRVGITHCKDWPLRFIVAGNKYVSGPRATGP